MSSKNPSPYSGMQSIDYISINDKKDKPKIREVLCISVLLVFTFVVGIGLGYFTNHVPTRAAEATSEKVVAAETDTKKEKHKWLSSLLETAEPDNGNLIEMKESTGETTRENVGIPFEPYCTAETEPSKLIAQTGIAVDDVEIPAGGTYTPTEEISFGTGSTYTDVEGIVTFRGNNFRDMPTYGCAEMKENILEPSWSANTGSLTYEGASWTGSGWTGQPLMMKWPQETKAHMNMYDWAKEKKDLVEVIYACMDGFVYFMDLETGEATRDTLELGFTFKGAGALDPRGYPILYVGAGYDSYKGTAHVFVVNLLDCSIMYEFGANDTYSLRGALSYFDSSALVDAETDTLIYPGENGILYLMKLNTLYDEKAGTLSINPSPVVKWHYYGTRSSVSSYWVGMEDSAAVYKGYLFVADNGGNLMCMNLNTLQLVWVQDILDDSNSTPVLSIEDDHLYIYVSTSFRLGWRSSSAATVPVWKIDAENGTIIWQKDYECYSADGVSGGVQSTIASGRGKLKDNIYVTVARTGEPSMGVLACLNKETGEAEWEHKSYYAWSSPVCVYDKKGNGKVIYCNSNGTMFLLDGKTGEELTSVELDGSNIEASPAIYENHAVIGTRGSKIWGVELK